MMTTHKAFGVDIVDFHGPPQQGSIGMVIPSRIAQKAKAMGMCAAANTGSMGSIFSSQNSSFFGNASTDAASTKQKSEKTYM